MVRDLTRQIARLRQLVEDLELVDAMMPPHLTLLSAPVLEDLAHGVRPLPCLEGRVCGHPDLPDGEVITTSEVYGYLDVGDQRLVRTLSRWYRLSSSRQETHGDLGVPSRRSRK